MNYNAASPVFSNWSIEELETEMMECYNHILSIPKIIPYKERAAFQEIADSAMSILNFMSVSQVVPDDFKNTLEPIYTEAKVRMNAAFQGYGQTPSLAARLIETNFGKAQQAYSENEAQDGDVCPECEAIDSIEPLYSGELRCIECGHTYFS